MVESESLKTQLMSNVLLDLLQQILLCNVYYTLYVRLSDLCPQNKIINVETHSQSEKCVSSEVLAEYSD